MFKITLSDTRLLVNSIPIIAEIIDEGIFNVDQNSISLLTPDRTMFSVVDFKILSTAFDEYKVDSPVTLGLNMGHLTNVLKRVKQKDRLVMESDGKNKLKVRIEGNGTRTFEIPLIDVKTEKPPVNQLSFPTNILIEGPVIEEAVADADIIGDSVVLESSPESFTMHARGDISSASMNIKKGDTGLIDLKSTGNAKSQYSLEYLKKMIKASKLSPNVQLEFGTDYPLRMTFRIIDKVHLCWVLAPRISED